MKLSENRPQQKKEIPIIKMLRNNCKNVFLISLLALFVISCFESCKSPVAPDEPEEPIRYRSKVKVTYIRNPAKIIFPQGNDWSTAIKYEIYDPNAEENVIQDIEYTDGPYRYGIVRMEKLAENKFVGYIEKVFIQTRSRFTKHKAYIRDYKLFDEVSDNSTYTAEGVTVEGAYDLSISGRMLYFRMSEE